MVTCIAVCNNFLSLGSENHMKKLYMIRLNRIIHILLIMGAPVPSPCTLHMLYMVAHLVRANSKLTM